MKPLIDIAQNFLAMPGEFGAITRLLVWAALFYFTLAIVKNAGKIWAALPKLKKWHFVAVAAIAVPAEFCSGQISDLLQTFEQPVYLTTYTALSEDARAAAFERVLQTKVSPAEFKVIQDSTAATARRIGVQPSDIYAVAWSECGLDPFCVRRDGVAAGWIQFTRNGLQCVGVDLAEVKRACARRDIVKMMEWTNRYLLTACSGKNVKDAGGVYLAVFAPAFAGCSPETVLYQGRGNSAYFLNSGIDGWEQLPNGQIRRLNRNIDFKITAGELFLMVEYKAAKLLEQ